MSAAEERRIRVTEYLDLEIDKEQWVCNRCNRTLGPARENYKKSCLVHQRDAREIHPPLVSGSYNFSPDPLWIRIVEFYCPGCGTQVETEYLPPGHPLTYDIELDLDKLKERLRSGEFRIRNKRIEVAE
jgi:acetophenone carboxylase